MPCCNASIFLLVITVSISVWCSMATGVPFPRSTAPVIYASLLPWLCCMFVVKVPDTCRNNIQDSISYLLRHKGATGLLLPSLYIMLQAQHGPPHRGSVTTGLIQSCYLTYLNRPSSFAVELSEFLLVFGNYQLTLWRRNFLLNFSTPCI
jgi:hypothetical protein